MRHVIYPRHARGPRFVARPTLALLLAALLAACGAPTVPEASPESLALRVAPGLAMAGLDLAVPFGGATTLEVDVTWPTGYEGAVTLTIDASGLPAGAELSATEVVLGRHELPWRVTASASEAVSAAALAEPFRLAISAATVDETPTGAPQSATLALEGGVRAVVTSAADAGPGSLRHLVGAVPYSATHPVLITFAPAAFAEPTTIALTHAIDVGVDLELRGPVDVDGAPLVTLHGGGVSERLIAIKDGLTVVLDSLTLTGAAHQAILNQGDLTVRNSVISGNGSYSEADGWGAAYGGGIHTLVIGALTLEGSRLSDNRAEHGGGVYAASPRVVVRGSTLADNVAFQGGGLYARSGVVDLLDTEVVGNEAQTGGGAFVHADARLVVERTGVVGNGTGTGSSHGGAGIASDGALVVRGSRIAENTAAVGGGGISASNGSTLVMTGTLVLDNVSGSNGGGLFNNGDASITNSTFTGNRALRGGGIFSSGNASAVTRLSFATVAWNAAYRTEGQTSATYGGGVANLNRVELNASLVVGNEVPAGYEGDDVYNSAGRIVLSLGRNLVGAAAGPAATGPGAVTDLHGVGADVTLARELEGDLAAVLPLVAGSQARDAVPLAECVDFAGDPVGVDQAGGPRPLGAACDAGAAEADAG